MFTLAIDNMLVFPAVRGRSVINVQAVLVYLLSWKKISFIIDVLVYYSDLHHKTANNWLAAVTKSTQGLLKHYSIRIQKVQHNLHAEVLKYNWSFKK